MPPAFHPHQGIARAEAEAVDLRGPQGLDRSLGRRRQVDGGLVTRSHQHLGELGARIAIKMRA